MVESYSQSNQGILGAFCYGSDEEKNTNKKEKPKDIIYNESKANESVKNGRKNSKSDNVDKGILELKKKIANVKLDFKFEDIEILPYKVFEEEIEYGKIEFKLKLNTCKDAKIEKIAAQMLFRIDEGNGECIFVIGIGDDGTAYGLDKTDLEESIKVLYLANKINKTTIKVLNFREGLKGLIGEILIEKELVTNKKLEIKIGLMGEESSGKSSLLGVLVSDIYDNGAGLSSKQIIRNKEQLKNPKTSSLNHQIIGFNENGKIKGKLHWPSLIMSASKIVNFYDLGGSSKALKNSLKSLSPNYLDYLALVISASSGITKNLIIYYKLAMAISIPVIFIITKTDLIKDEFDQTEFLNNLNNEIKKVKSGKNLIVTKSLEDVVLYSRLIQENIIPIFMVSNVTGEGLSLLINFLDLIPRNTINEDDLDENVKFDILSILSLDKESGGNKKNSIYNKKDLSKMTIKEEIEEDEELYEILKKKNSKKPLTTVESKLQEVSPEYKTILVGIVSEGTINKNQKLLIGPDSNKKFKEVIVKGIHCKKVNVKRVLKGQYCSLEVDIKETDVRKGMVLIDHDSKRLSCKSFEAEVWNIGDKDIRIVLKKTQLAISCEHIRQVAIVKRICLNEDLDSKLLSSELKEEDKEDKDIIIKPDENITLEMEFVFNPEYLNVDSHIVILDSMKFYGIIKKILT